MLQHVRKHVRVLPIAVRMRSEGYSSRSVCLLNTVLIHKQLGHGNTLHLSCDIFSVLAEDVQYTECLQKVCKDAFILLILFYFSLACDVYHFASKTSHGSKQTFLMNQHNKVHCRSLLNLCFISINFSSNSYYNFTFHNEHFNTIPEMAILSALEQYS